VKSVIAAANNAYEGVNKASKQVSDAVAANVTGSPRLPESMSGPTARQGRRVT
jgi:hypothetical protein